MCYVTVDGEIALVEEMIVFGTWRSQKTFAQKIVADWKVDGRDTLGGTSLGQFLTRAYDETLRVQGPVGPMASGGGLEAAFSGAKGRDALQAWTIWQPKQGPKSL
jgi:hypothetical protein